MTIALAWTAAILTSLSAIIRFVVTFRSPSLSGVSAWFPWLALVATGGWLAFGVSAGVPAQIPASLAWLVTLSYMILRIHRSGRDQRRAAAICLVASLMVVIMSLRWPDSAAYVAGLLVISATVPQVARTWRSRDRQGVGPAAWTYSLIMALTWATYGALSGHTPLFVTHSLYALTIVAILVGYARAESPPPHLTSIPRPA